MKDLQCNFDGSGVVGWGSTLDSAETRRALVVAVVVVEAVVVVAFSSFPIAGSASCRVVGEWPPPDGVEGKLTSEEAVVFGGDAVVDQVSPIEGIGFPMT